MWFGGNQHHLISTHHVLSTSLVPPGDAEMSGAQSLPSPGAASIDADKHHVHQWCSQETDARVHPEHQTQVHSRTHTTRIHALSTAPGLWLLQSCADLLGTFLPLDFCCLGHSFMMSGLLRNIIYIGRIHHFKVYSSMNLDKCMQLCNHCYSQDIEHFPTARSSLSFPTTGASSPQILFKSPPAFTPLCSAYIFSPVPNILCTYCVYM